MKKPVLLVDDEPHILETAQDILEAAGYEALGAETAAAALALIQEHSFGLMIVDFNLLDMTGAQLAMKARAIRPDLVIVLMTGETSVELGEAQASIHAILTKPVNPPELLKFVKQFCDK